MTCDERLCDIILRRIQNETNVSNEKLPFIIGLSNLLFSVYISLAYRNKRVNSEFSNSLFYMRPSTHIFFLIIRKIKIMMYFFFRKTYYWNILVTSFITMSFIMNYYKIHSSQTNP